MMIGISVISAYSTAIIAESGVEWGYAELCTVGLKVLSFATYILCLLLVDRIGRRVLMMASIAGSASMWTLVVGAEWVGGWGRSLLATSLIFAAQFFMNVGIRPLFYVLVPELFPFRYRTAGKSLSALLGVLLCIPILFAFWPLFQVIRFWVFLGQAIPLWAALAFLASRLPETKGRRSDDIFAQLQGSAVPGPLLSNRVEELRGARDRLSSDPQIPATD